MTDFITMITRIEDECDDEDIRDQIKNAIQTAIRFYSTKRLFLNEGRFTFATVAGQESYALAAAADIDTFLEVQDSYLTSGGIRYPFVPVDYPTLSESQSGLITGRPTNWAFFARSFWPYPIPDAVYTATINAHVRLAALVNDADTNAWMTDGEELIRQRAKRIIAIDVTKEPSDALAAEALETMALDALERETKLRRGRRLLRPDAALVTAAPYNINIG